MSEETILMKGTAPPAEDEPGKPGDQKFAPAAGAPIRGAWDWLWGRPSWDQAQDRIVHQFALAAQELREPAELHAQFVACAGRLAEAERVELLQDQGPGRPVSVVATWPPEFRVSAALQPKPAAGSAPAALDGRPLNSDEFQAFTDSHGRGRSSLLLVPMRCGGGLMGTLKIWAKLDKKRTWHPKLVRKLTILATLAGACERALKSARLTDIAIARDPVTGLQSAQFLGAYLAQALDPETPRYSSMVLICIGLSRLPRIRDEHGAEVVDAMLQRVARTIVQTVRGSDIVARHDDRIVIALGGAKLADALKVARSVEHAIFEAGVVSAVSFRLSSAIGIAAFPDHAHDAESLLEAVFSAQEMAKQSRRDRIHLAIGKTKSPMAIYEPVDTEASPTPNGSYDYERTFDP